MAGAEREILLLGDPRLRHPGVAVPVEHIATVDTQQVVDDLIATMRAASGAGLAATQVGVGLRICVIEVDDNPRYPYKPKIPLTVLINPVLTPLSDEVFENNEGCLSVPGLRGNVQRRTELRVQALDRCGAPLDFEVRGLSAGTFQHECDHLDGLLFVDRLTTSTSLATWDTFVRFQQPEYLERVEALIARYGS